MRRLALAALLLFPGVARADQIDAIGPLVEMVVYPVGAVIALVGLAVAASLRARSRTAAVVVAGLGLLPLAGFGAVMIGDGGVLLLLLAGFVASLFAMPKGPRGIE